MKYTIYSKPDCIWCDRAKAYMKKHHVEYTEKVIGTDVTREEFIDLFPQQKTVPYILDESWNPIGGYNELKALLDSASAV